MRIHLTSVLVDDQAKAHDVYTRLLGFETKNDVPVGEDRWLTVVSPEEPDGPELLLEPNRLESARAFQKDLFAKGIPAASFAVDDVQAEYDRLRELGMTLQGEPTPMGPVIVAAVDDTCGNWIQLMEQVGEPEG